MISDDKAIGSESGFDIGHQRNVGDGVPCVGGPWSGNIHDDFAFDGMGSAMQQEVGAATRCLDLIE